jgi:hypothetical protein
MEQQPVQSAYNLTEKPGMVTALGIMTLVSGILNILTALGLTTGIVLGTLGIGLLCAPITLLPGVLGVFEILYAVKLIANPPVAVKFSQTIAILEICCVAVGNVVAMIVGILALVFYNDAAVKAWFDRINPPEAA